VHGIHWSPFLLAGPLWAGWTRWASQSGCLSLLQQTCHRACSLFDGCSPVLVTNSNRKMTSRFCCLNPRWPVIRWSILSVSFSTLNPGYVLQRIIVTWCMQGSFGVLDAAWAWWKWCVRARGCGERTPHKVAHAWWVKIYTLIVPTMVLYFATMQAENGWPNNQYIYWNNVSCERVSYGYIQLPNMFLAKRGKNYTLKIFHQNSLNIHAW